MAKNYRVEMLDISKSFGGVQALKDVTLKVKKNEIHALVGENGAGKSTLMKILSGVYSPDSGVMKINGGETTIDSPQQGKEKGISIIYQEFSLVPHLSVAENIFLDELGESGIIHWDELYERAARVIEEVGFEINPRKEVGRLSVAYQQVVEICKALSRDAKILILDEPTAVLAPSEIEILFDILRNLKSKGVAIIYISHRLEEIFALADKATVLKDGEVTGVVDPAVIEENDIIELMIGREISDMFPERKGEIGGELFRVEGLTNDKIKDITFSVKQGEVFGIAGLVGNGRTETARAIFGADSITGGKMFLEDRELKITSPRQALKYGIGMLPESRKEQGVILPMSVKENVTMTSLQKVMNWGILKRGKEDKIVKDLVDKLQIKTPGINTTVFNLSGGNQQKVSLAKWFGANCKLMIMDEPTRGVDVGAKIEIYKLINELAKQGLGIIMISSEMTEIIGLCDRAAVLHRGEISGILDKNELTEKNIMNLATGREKANGKISYA